MWGLHSLQVVSELNRTVGHQLHPEKIGELFGVGKTPIQLGSEVYCVISRGETQEIFLYNRLLINGVRAIGSPT